MTDPAAQTSNQLRNIEAATGRTMTDFAADVAAPGVQGHARIVAFLKERDGLSYGNANAVALKVRELAAGGPPPSDALLDAQYAGAKAVLRPLSDQVVAMAQALGPDVQVVIQKTAVALRRKKQLGVVQAASAKRLQLGLNLSAEVAAAAGSRVTATPGAMCSHRVDIAGPQDLDEALATLLRHAYDRAG